MTVKKKLTPLDMSYLLFETPETPQHVSAMMVFKKPEDADPNYLKDLVRGLRAVETLRAPFNKQLNGDVTGTQPFWTFLDKVDLDYHVRHIALPAPGGDAELMNIVSLIHAQRLARSRPMWEFYIIENYHKDQFVGFFKIHHSVIDGVGAMRLMNATLSKDPTEAFVPPWSVRSKTSRQKTEASIYEMIKTAYGEAMQQAKTMPALTRSLSKMAIKALTPKERSTLPFAAPRSMFNERIGNTRGLGIRSFPLDRIKALTKQAGCSVNDVVLAMCSGALRQYLLDHSALPAKSLIALIPVSIRTQGSDGNQFASLLCDLATTEATPLDRLNKTRLSMLSNKKALEAMGPKGVAHYSNLLSAPFAFTQVLRVSEKLRPAFNLVISNVPGPKDKVYLKGAELEALYAGTLLFQGQAVSILITSYFDTLDFCVTVCKDKVPDYETICDYLNDELVALEAAAAG